MLDCTFELSSVECLVYEPLVFCFRLFSSLPLSLPFLFSSHSHSGSPASRCTRPPVSHGTLLFLCLLLFYCAARLFVKGLQHFYRETLKAFQNYEEYQKFGSSMITSLVPSILVVSSFSSSLVAHPHSGNRSQSRSTRYHSFHCPTFGVALRVFSKEAFDYFLAMLCLIDSQTPDVNLLATMMLLVFDLISPFFFPRSLSSHLTVAAL